MLVSIDEGNRQPIYLQIVRQIKEQILVGELTPGDELPSVRDLGDALGISLHTARNAYQVLAEEGLLRVRLGKKARAMMPDRPIDPSLMNDETSARMRELVVDVLLQGSDAEALHGLLEREITALLARGATLGSSVSEEENA